MTDTVPIGLIVVRLTQPVKNYPVGTELGYKDVADAIAALGSAHYFEVVRDQAGNPIPPLTPEEIEEAQRAAQRRAKSRRLILGADFDPLWDRVDGIPSATELEQMRQDVEAVADVPPRVEAVEETVSTVETAIQRVDPGTTGSENQALRRGPQGPVWADDIINVKAAGAKGDGVTDDTAILQALIDEHAIENGGRGANLYFPPGTYRANLVLKSGIVLTSMRESVGRVFSNSNMVLLRGFTDGWVIDSIATRIISAGVVGIDVASRSGSSGVGGIRIRDGMRCAIKRIHFHGFQGPGLSFLSGASSTIEELLTTSCCANRTPGQLTGAVEIFGTDHFIDNIEAGTSNQNDLDAVSGPDLFLAGLVLGCTNSFIQRVYGEFSDVGVVVSGDRNRIGMSRGDNNYGPDWMVTGARNRLVACDAYAGSKNNPGAYSGFLVGGGNILVGCSATGGTYKYGYEHTGTTTGDVRARAQLIGCTGSGYALSLFSPGSMWTGFAPLSAPNLHRPTGNPTTIDATMLGTIVLTGYTAPTTITDFLNGVNGQVLTLIGDPDVTIANNATIKTATGTDFPLAANRAYQFAFFDGKWYQVGA